MRSCATNKKNRVITTNRLLCPANLPITEISMNSIAASNFEWVPNVRTLLNEWVVMDMQHIHLTRTTLIPPSYSCKYHIFCKFCNCETSRITNSMNAVHYWGSEHSDHFLSITALTLGRRISTQLSQFGNEDNILEYFFHLFLFRFYFVWVATILPFAQ